MADLETHYRSCACRKNTFFFSKREIEVDKNVSSHTQEDYRNPFQLDRDKIIHSRAFRRLRLKSQVFPEHVEDHLRTRMDHTLEVAQIAGHLARALGLNEDLVNAISLAHDIGHTPFAHSGERALDKLSSDLSELGLHFKLSGFKHNWHGLRIVDKLEKAYPELNGLNLTNAVRIGILYHTGLIYRKREEHICDCNVEPIVFDDKKELDFNYNKKHDPRCNILEVQVCAIADEIAQVVHDFEDAVYSEQVPFFERLNKLDGGMKVIDNCLDNIQAQFKKFDDTTHSKWEDIKKWQKIRELNFDGPNRKNKSLLMSRIRSELINELINDVIEHTKVNLEKFEDNLGFSDREQNEDGTLSEVRKNPEDDIVKFNQQLENGQVRFESTVFDDKKNKFKPIIDFGNKKDDFEKLGEYLLDNLIYSDRINRMDSKAAWIIKQIIRAYVKQPKQIPNSVLELCGVERKTLNDMKTTDIDKNMMRAIIDFIAGMTDRYALREYDRLYSAYPRTLL